MKIEKFRSIVREEIVKNLFHKLVNHKEKAITPISYDEMLDLIKNSNIPQERFEQILDLLKAQI
jgi:hypothetical protein